MTEQIAFFIESADHFGAVSELAKVACVDAGLELLLAEEGASLSRFEALLSSGRHPIAAVIGPHVKRSLVIARRVHRAAPDVQVVFLGDEARARSVRLEMSLAPMVGQYRVVPDDDPSALAALLREMASRASKRARLNRRLERVNEQLASRAHLDSAEFRRLAISERFFARLVNQAVDAIFSLDAEGRVISWNRAAEQLFGPSANQAVGRPLLGVVPPESQTVFERLLEQVSDGGQEARGDIQILRNSPVPTEIELSLAPVDGPAGERIGISVIARDVTERNEALRRERQAREQAEEANRTKDEFLAMVSHELRTPLNSIVGWMRLLRSGRLDRATYDRGLDTIERNVVSQTQLIEDLLDISRIVTGKLRLDVRPVELEEVVASAVEAVRVAADAKSIELQSVLDPAAGPVVGDPERLRQIVWNLLSNAIKFTPKRGRVQIHLRRVESSAELTVSDTGQGIDAELLHHIFERFRQADGGITRRHGGLGLGLAIVRHLVELHGGTVTAESAGLGQGATFRVRLPIAITRETRERPAQPAAAPELAARPFDRAPALDGARVLVVDDEPDTREMLSVVLTQCGASVRAVGMAVEALEALDEWAPDILISDIGMPEHDGYWLIERVRERPRERGGSIPAVALTAYARYSDRVRALMAGFQMHVAKPVEPAELMAVVQSLLALAGRR